MTWLEAGASAETIVRAFLSSEIDPDDTLCDLFPQVGSNNGDRQATRQLLTAKFEQVVGPWAAENNISAQAFERMGIQPEHLTGMTDH